MNTHATLLAATLLLSSLSFPAPAAESTGYLFDLTAEEITALMDRYVGRGHYDAGLIQMRMRAPLDCRQHQALCTDLGPDYTYLVLQQIWSQGRRGERIERIREDAAVLADTLTDRSLEYRFPDGIDPRSALFGSEGSTATCSDAVVHADSGPYRLRVSARAVDGGLVSAQWARSELNKLNNRGKYRAERADYIEIAGTFFITAAITQEALPFTEFAENEKRVTAFFPTAGGPLSGPKTEGCGQVRGPVALSACACSG